METEREKSMRRVFMPKNKYGYEVNIQNPVLQAWYESYKRRLGIHGAPSDKQRLEWESRVKDYLRKEYYKLYNYYLSDSELWVNERLEELVQRLGVKPMKSCKGCIKKETARKEQSQKETDKNWESAD